MTPEQHKVVGAILGYPPCCAAAFAAGAAACESGSIYVGRRTLEEARSLCEQVSAYLGYAWGLCASGPFDLSICYVPCAQCALTDARWKPWP